MNTLDLSNPNQRTFFQNFLDWFRLAFARIIKEVKSNTTAAVNQLLEEWKDGGEDMEAPTVENVAAAKVELMAAVIDISNANIKDMGMRSGRLVLYMYPCLRAAALASGQTHLQRLPSLPVVTDGAQLLRTDEEATAALRSVGVDNELMWNSESRRVYYNALPDAELDALEDQNDQTFDELRMTFGCPLLESFGWENPHPTRTLAADRRREKRAAQKSKLTK